MELRRPRGFATFITYPLKDASGTIVSGVTTLRPQYATFTDANPVSTITNIAGFCSELGATGIYYSSLSAAEMANDYIYVIASATSGSSKRLDILINCTRIASVTQVMNPVPIDWASITSPTTTQNLTGTTIATANNVATVNFCASVSAAVLSNVATVTGVTNSVTANVATITGVVNSVSVTTVTGVSNSVGVREGTGGNVLSLTNGRVGLDWTNIVNATSTQAFPLTTIGTVSNVATVQFVASVGAVVLSSVGTVTGVTNSVTANVATVTGVTNSIGVRAGTGANTLNIANGRVGINWTDIANATGTQGFTLTTFATASHVDDLTSTTYPEPAAVPAATATLKNKLNWLTILGRNQVTISSVTQVVWDDAGTATVSFATHSDASGLFTKNEWS